MKAAVKQTIDNLKKAALRASLEGDYETEELPEKVRVMLWEYAYREGHAGGNLEIEYVYEDVAKIVLVAAKEAGRGPVA